MMRLPVRVFLRCLSILLIFFLLLPIFTTFTHAQVPTDSPNQFIAPNVEDNVPQNQHTFVQSLFLEILLAIQCQLTGIDLTDPTKSCLGINLQTGKLGYAPPGTNNGEHAQIGGLLGIVTQGISTMYTPTFGTREYLAYVSDSFSIVKPTHAAAYTGFQGLQPVLELWKTTRDIAYYLLIIAFIFIGIGVMLRLKIDPRTVMTIQNQIPRVIISIILITFSYAFAALLIDAMWAVTYMGVNKITESSNPDLTGSGDTLSKVATTYLLDHPLGFVHETFVEENSPDASGFFNTAYGVGQALGNIETDILVNLFTGNSGSTECLNFSWYGAPSFSIGGCLQLALSWFIGLIWFIVVGIALLIALFKIWFELLKAYLMVLLYVILGPIWIVFGLLPKRPLGFEKWLRVYFANLAVFPAVVFILVGARVLHDLFNAGASYRFVPPLIGNPSTEHFGAIVEFAMILLAPQLLSLIREKLGTPPLKQVGAALQTFNAGRAAAGAPAKQAVKHWNKRDQYGNAIGPLAKYTDKATNAVSRLPVIGGMTGHDRNQWVKQNYTARGYDEAEKVYKQARSAAPDKKAFDAEHKGSVTQWANNVGFESHRGQWGGLSPEALGNMGIKLNSADAAKAARLARTDGSGGLSPQERLARGMAPYEEGQEHSSTAGAAPDPRAAVHQAGQPTTQGEDAAGTTGGAHSALTITIVGPAGAAAGAITIDPANPTHSSTSVQQIVIPQIQQLQIPPEQKTALVERINNEAQDTTSHWNMRPGELDDSHRRAIESTLSSSINPTSPPGETA